MPCCRGGAPAAGARRTLARPGLPCGARRSRPRSGGRRSPSAGRRTPRRRCPGDRRASARATALGAACATCWTATASPGSSWSRPRRTGRAGCASATACSGRAAAAERRRRSPRPTGSATARPGNVGAEASALVGRPVVDRALGVDRRRAQPAARRPAAADPEPHRRGAAVRAAGVPARRSGRSPRPTTSAVDRAPPGRAARRRHARWTGSWHTVFVTVDRRGGTPVDADFEAELRGFLERSGWPATTSRSTRRARAARDRARRSASSPATSARREARRCLEVFSRRTLPGGGRGFFHPDNFTFGQPVYLSQVIARGDAGDRRRERRRRRRAAAPGASGARASPGGARSTTGLHPARRGSRSRGSTTTRARPRTGGSTSTWRAACERRQLDPAAAASRPGGAGDRQPAGPAGARLPDRHHGRRFLRGCSPSLPRQAVADRRPGDGARPLVALTTRAADDPAIALLDAWATVGDVLTFYQERIANEGFLRTATERPLGARVWRGSSATSSTPASRPARSWPSPSTPPTRPRSSSRRARRCRASRRPERAAADLRDRRGSARAAGVERAAGAPTAARHSTRHPALYLAGVDTGLVLRRPASPCSARTGRRPRATPRSPSAGTSASWPPSSARPAHGTTPLVTLDRGWATNTPPAGSSAACGRVHRGARRAVRLERPRPRLMSADMPGNSAAASPDARRGPASCFADRPTPRPRDRRLGRSTSTASTRRSSRAGWICSATSCDRRSSCTGSARHPGGRGPTSRSRAGSPASFARRPPSTWTTSTAAPPRVLAGQRGAARSPSARPHSRCRDLSCTLGDGADVPLAAPAARRLVAGTADGRRAGRGRSRRGGRAGRPRPTPPLVEPRRRATGAGPRRRCVIHGNVVTPPMARTVPDEVLGTGDAAAADQRFPLAAPAADLGAGVAGASAARSPCGSTACAGSRWPTLYTAGPRDRVYTLRREPRRRRTIGRRSATASAAPGCRPASRTSAPPTAPGSASPGRSTPGSSRCCATAPLGLQAVTNPAAAAGAADPEPRRHRRTRPLTVLTLDRWSRCRTTRTTPRAFPGIGKALARRSCGTARRGFVHLTVAERVGERARPSTSPVQRRCCVDLAALQDPAHSSSSTGHVPLTFAVALTLLIDPRLRLADGRWPPARRRSSPRSPSPRRQFGQPVTAAEVIAAPSRRRRDRRRPRPAAPTRHGRRLHRRRPRPAAAADVGRLASHPRRAAAARRRRRSTSA